MAITLRTKALLLAAGLFSVFVLPAQNHLITERNIRDCDGFFLDSGGPRDKYENNENYTTTICPDTTVGTHVQLIFSRPDIETKDALCFFDGPTVTAPSLECIDNATNQGFTIQATASNPSGCITVTFKSDAGSVFVSSRGEGWSAEIKCVAACQTILAEMVSTDPIVVPADTGWIDVCPGERISFTARGKYPQNGIFYQHSDANSEFTWFFEDGTRAVGPSVTHAYQKSGGYIVQVQIKDKRGCTSTNLISQRVRVSNKPTFAIGDSIPQEICVGDTFALSAVVNEVNRTYAVSAETGEGSFQVGGARSDSLALPDGDGTSYETMLRFSNFSPGQTLTNISDIQSICVNMEHSWIRDLKISITCPNGQTDTLHNFGGRAGSETYLGVPIDFDGTNPTPGKGFDYCWVMGAPNGTWLEYANRLRPRTLPAGDYAPFESFDKLVGCPLNGEWKIRVEDLWKIDNGYIFSWGINFQPSLFPNLEKFTNQIVDYSWKNNGSIFNFSQTDIQASPRNAGTASYVFSITDDFGCNYDTTVNVTVLPPTHPNCRNCEQILIPEKDTAVCDVQPIPLNVGVPITQQQTPVLFETTPSYTFGADTHGPSNPYLSPINVSGIFPTTINNVNQQIDSVCIDIETDWLDDLDIFLVSPSGKQLELTTGNGADSDFYTHTCFRPGATNNIRAGQPPFTGTYAPEGNWSDLNGSPTIGNWKLRVIDQRGVDGMGVLKSWSIAFRSTNAINYTWTPSAGLSCANCPNPTATPARTTNYVVTARDNYSCVSTDTLTLGVFGNAPAPQVTCSITGDTALQFNWLPVNGFPSFEVNPIVNGVPMGWQGPVNDIKYILSGLSNNDTVTMDVRSFTGGNATNCVIDSGSATCAFIICELVIDSISAKPADCHGNSTGTASVFVSQGVGVLKYSWSDTLQQIAPNAVFLKAGNYKVTVTDANECIGVGNITVQQPDSIAIAPAITDALCVGESNGVITANVSGGIGNYNYAWSTGQTSKTATALKTGTYTVSVTDANGCKNQQAIFVDEPTTALSVAVTQTLLGCNGAKKNEVRAVAAGGTGNAYKYTWSNGQTTATATNLDSISYTVMAADSNGCKAAQTLKATDLAPITTNLIISQPTCDGSKDGAMGVNIVTGGVGKNERDYTFRWSTGQTGNAIKNLAGGATYAVTVTDAQGCTGISSRLLEQPPAVAFEVDVKNALCFGSDDGSATVLNPTGQGTRYTFRWDERAKNQATAAAASLTAGSYSVTVTDEKGCISSKTISIAQPTKIETKFEIKNSLCFGDDKGAVAVKANGGTPTYTYAWSNNTATDKLNAIVAGTYQLTVTDANGCIHTSAAEVKQPTQLIAALTPLDPACNKGRDGSIAIVPTGGTSPYQFSLDNKNFNNISKLIGLKANNYNIYVKDAQGCTIVDKVEIKDPPRFVVDAGNLSYTVRLGDSINLSAASINGVGTVSYVWSAPYEGTLSCSECDSVFAKPENMIIYELYAIDEKGCEATDKVTVIVQKIREVAVPTGFTPNADGMNDLLMVHGLSGTKIKSFRVFDRWGELLYDFGDFMINDKANGWDGNFRSAPASAGVYIWQLEVEYVDGMTEILKGQTTLIR